MSEGKDSTQVINYYKRLRKQNYHKLKSACLSSKRLFVDDLFLPNESSMYKSRKIHGVQWKRPHEIVKNPKFFVDQASSKDVVQGSIGNCWFVAALSVLATEKRILNKVIPDADRQTFDDNYAGIFRFQFWQFGKWVEVVIDDLLPTVNNRLIFTHSSTDNEFWSCLTEKAYAKLNGCYENLDGGNLSEALQDFTGGVCEKITIDQDFNGQENLFEAMKKAYERRSLMACAINVKSVQEIETTLSNGLVKGHAYGITKVVNMQIRGNKALSFLPFAKEKLAMIRLKNPWGQHEWLGAWSDNSAEWKQVPKSERDRLGLNFDDDGEFWMEFGDFLRYFNETWSESVRFGEWTRPDRAGGCVNNRDTFLDNPQYLFEVRSESSSRSDEVIINLDQLGLRCLGKDHLTVGFFIMRVEDNRRYRLHKIFPEAASSIFSNTRSVFLRERLPNGRYVIIPSTFRPGLEGMFMLRIYTDEGNCMVELQKDNPKPFCLNPFGKYASCVTSIVVKSGSGLMNPDSKSGFDTYLRIKCEKDWVVGKVLKSSLDPEWNTGAIFYRYKQDKPIKIEVWIKKTLNDEMYGYVMLDAEPNNKHYMIESNLTGYATTKGRIKVEVQSMSNIKDL